MEKVFNAILNEYSFIMKSVKYPLANKANNEFHITYKYLMLLILDPIVFTLLVVSSLKHMSFR